ncbi:MAG: energy transducer TonB [bacterium]|nr:energy transducer TonB [bacterium]
MNPKHDHQDRLRAYESAEWRAPKAGRGGFRGMLGASLLLSVGLGLALLTVDLPPLLLTAQEARRASFLVEEERLVAVPEIPEVIEEPVEEIIEDLTEMPVLDQEETLPAVEAPEPTPVEPEPEPEVKPRRVYGVRKVFAKGLGAGGGGNGGIVTKLGNTLNKEPDELEATEAELTGSLAPLSTVSSAPSLIGRVRPEYTKEMVENRVSGLVRARLLVDSDGSVKGVEILEDIGFGSKEAATTAFRQLRFKPALRADKPVAVWIIMKYRFELQE